MDATEMHEMTFLSVFQKDQKKKLISIRMLYDS